MKRKIGFALLSLAMLASCSQEEVNGTVGAEQDVITLGTMTQSMNTRAAINDLAGLSAEGTKVGIYGVETAAAKPTDVLTADWTATPKMPNVPTTAIDKISGIMTWANPESYVYPKDNVAKPRIKFMAYYPYAAIGDSGDNYVTASGSATSPKLNFTLTGQEDLMWATPVIGSRIAPASVLKFNHKLTQFTFQLKDTKGNFTSGKGAVKNVKINANTKGVMDLESGVVSNWSTPTDITVSSGEIATISMGVPVPLNTTTMLQSGLGSFNVTLSYAGTGSSPEAGTINGTIKPVGEATSTFLAGKAYLITLGLSGDVLVQLAAEVVPWTTGGVGEGNLEVTAP